MGWFHVSFVMWRKRWLSPANLLGLKEAANTLDQANLNSDVASALSFFHPLPPLKEETRPANSETGQALRRMVLDVVLRWGRGA